jgi:hypothetical protein
LRCAAWLAIVSALSLSCSRGATAMSVCHMLEDQGVAAGCQSAAPEGLGAEAVERADFHLPTAPTKTGQVLRFGDAQTFDRAAQTFAGAKGLGAHQYGSRKALVFLQMSEGPPLMWERAKDLIDAL